MPTCTTLKAKDFINDCFTRKLDGSILSFIDKYKNYKCSFAKINKEGFVLEVKEKVPISEYATVGIYLFKKGKDFVKATNTMIEANDRINGEFYTCPVYSYLIKNSKKIGIYNIPSKDMHGIRTPEDLQEYIKLLKVKK